MGCESASSCGGGRGRGCGGRAAVEGCVRGGHIGGRGPDLQHRLNLRREGGGEANMQNSPHRDSLGGRSPGDRDLRRKLSRERVQRSTDGHGP